MENHFQTPAEEIHFWRVKAEEYKNSLEEVREELEEFQVSSRELELELETQLEQAERRSKELTTANEKLSFELESLKERVESSQSQLHRQVTRLQEDLTRVSSEKEELQRYIRELEQCNDDLERTKRVTVVSLDDFEGKLNQAIERNAILENELDEKESLLVLVQRLKDEARDLRQELDVRNKPGDTPDASVDGEMEPGMVSSSLPNGQSRHLVESTVQTDHIDSNRLSEPILPSPLSPSLALTPTSALRSQGAHNSQLTPSMRISALNLVGDLLRKVGALESKLATCRSYVDDNRVVTPSSSSVRRPNAGIIPIQAVSPGSSASRSKPVSCDTR